MKRFFFAILLVVLQPASLAEKLRLRAAVSGGPIQLAKRAVDEPEAEPKKKQAEQVDDNQKTVKADRKQNEETSSVGDVSDEKEEKPKTAEKAADKSETAEKPKTAEKTAEKPKTAEKAADKPKTAEEPAENTTDKPKTAEKPAENTTDKPNKTAEKPAENITEKPKTDEKPKTAENTAKKGGEKDKDKDASDAWEPQVPKTAEENKSPKTRAGPWEAQYPSTTENTKSTKDQPSAWEPQYPDKEQKTAQEAQDEPGDSKRKLMGPQTGNDEEDDKKSSEKKEVEESDSSKKNKSESKEDDNKSSEKKEVEETDSSKKNKSESKDAEDKSDKKTTDEKNKTTDSKEEKKEKAAKEPYNAFLPDCRKELKRLVTVAEAAYGPPQLEPVLESECEMDKEFPGIRDRFFDRRKECKAFAHSLAEARKDEMKGKTEAYDDCCKDWWEASATQPSFARNTAASSHELKSVGSNQHKNYFWYMVGLGALCTGLV